MKVMVPVVINLLQAMIHAMITDNTYVDLTKYSIFSITGYTARRDGSDLEAIARGGVDTLDELSDLDLDMNGHRHHPNQQQVPANG